jgi:hypothetical protein
MKKNSVYYAKFIAILLVLNSHMDELYPISALAVGGHLVIHCSSL